jgi:DNA polymerase
MTPAEEWALWETTYAEAQRRGKAHLARGVYARRAGAPCPFTPTEAPAVPTPTPPLFLDFETRSRVDLASCGQDVYAADPSTSVLIVGYAIGDGEPVSLMTRDAEMPECPEIIRTHIDLLLPVVAHNAAFEAAIWSRICVGRWGWPEISDRQWIDTMALAGIRALPLSLGGCAAALGLPVQKDDGGRRLMLKWCKPRKPTANDRSEWHHDPAEYQALANYCGQDVRVEREIWGKLHAAMTDAERAVWLASWRMNRRGIPLDRAGALAAQRIVALNHDAWGERVTSATGGALTRDTMGSRADVLRYLHARGVHLGEWDSAAVTGALGKPMPEDARTVLLCRAATGRSSVAKAHAMLDRAASDDRIRDQFVYHGATTGRWTARGIQPQNLPRDQVDDVDACLADARGDLDTFRLLWGEPADAIAGCIRGLICAPDGHVLVAGDYAQIEARVLLWLAGDAAGLALFGPGQDIYCAMASEIYGRPITKKDKAERQVGKMAILGLGFGMGPTKFHDSCQAQGIFLPAAMEDAIVKTYRKKFVKVKNLWYDVEDAAVQTVAAGEVPAPRKAGKVAFALRGGDLRCRLPSGRLLNYPKAMLVEKPTPWGENKMALQFWGEDQTTKQWRVTDSYGGKLVENITQAVARDLMADALVRADAAGWNPCMTVHDELVCVCPDPQGKKDLPRELEALMVASPAWAQGIPLAAEAWAGRRYQK